MASIAAQGAGIGLRSLLTYFARREIVVAGGAGAAAIVAAGEISNKKSKCANGSNQAQCNNCRLTTGVIGYPTNRYISNTNYENYDYQIYIANLHAKPEVFSYVKIGGGSNNKVYFRWRNFISQSQGAKYTVSEWIYGGIDFDGFWRSPCTVVEAKGNYDAWGNSMEYVKKIWLKKEIEGWATGIYAKQQAVVNSAAPQGKLEWHFMQLRVYNFAIANGMPLNICHYTPMV